MKRSLTLDPVQHDVTLSLALDCLYEIGPKGLSGVKLCYMNIRPIGIVIIISFFYTAKSHITVKWNDLDYSCIACLMSGMC